MISRYFTAINFRRHPWLGLALLSLLFTAACGGNAGDTPAADATVLPRRTPTPGSLRPMQPGKPTTLTGALDPTFGQGGKVTTDFGSTLEAAHGVVVQPDGKIVAAGTAGVDPNDILNADFGLARYR